MSSSCLKSFAAAGLALLCAQAQAQTAGWEFDPRIEVRALHDDNYRLSDVEGAEIEVTGGFLDAELGFRSQTPTGLMELRPRVRSSVFPDEGGEESTDLFLGFGWQHRTPRMEGRVDATYSDESVVTSELVSAEFPDVELGDVVAGDSGRVTVRNRRSLINVRPSVGWRWMPTRKLEAGLSFIDASFDESLIEQTGFTDIVATGGVVFDVSQRDSVAGRLRAGMYEPDNARDDTQRYGAEAEWTRRWSPTTRVYVRGGVDTSETTVTQLDARRRPTLVEVSNTSVIGGIGAMWTFEVTQIVLDAVRGVSPSSSGVVVNRDELRLRMRRDITARFAVLGNIRSLRTRGAVEDIADVNDRDYLTGRLGLEWRMSRQVQLQCAYDYAWQEFEGEPADATSNAISVSFVYEPRRRD